MGWTAWNWINVMFIFVSGWLAYDMFKNDRTTLGWLNLFASSMNGAAVASRLL